MKPQRRFNDSDRRRIRMWAEFNDEQTNSTTATNNVAFLFDAIDNLANERDALRTELAELRQRTAAMEQDAGGEA